MMEQLFLIISTLLLTAGYAYDNRVRGSADKPWYIPGKWAAYAWFTILLTVCTWFYYGQELFHLIPIPFTNYSMEMWQLLLIDYPITWFCFAFGWGDFFPHGRKDLISDMSMGRKKEFWPADTLANIIYGNLHSGRDSKFLKNWQTIAMSFRFGLTFGLLKFPFLAFVFEDWRIALLGIPMFLAGPIYRIAFIKHDKYSIPKAEYMIGALIGILTAMIFWMRRKNDKRN